MLILGAGGHAKVIADAVLRAGLNLVGYLDDNVELHGTSVLGYPILGPISAWQEFQPSGLVVGVGDIAVRRRIVNQMESSAKRIPWKTVVHPTAVVADSVVLGNGTVVFAGAVINPDSRIGEHTIINTAATVDHDCILGDFVHVAPGANLAGGVVIDSGALIGVGAVIVPGRRIGTDAVVGAGAVVVSDVPPHRTAKGVPARWEQVP